jgi:disulfide bond formation protein DsbB
VTRLFYANGLALLIPAALMAGALGAQYIGGLYPCEMCHWQRWPHYAAIVIAITAYGIRPLRSPLVALAALSIMTSGAIAVFHAGVEYHWWQGLTTCSSTASGRTLQDIMRAPLIRCDQAQWTLFGISLAGFNAIVSILGGVTILGLIGAKR